MTELAARPPIALDDPSEEAEEGISLSANLFDRLFDRLWHLFISMRTGLALILFLAFFAAAGTLLPQAPAAVTADPASYAQWLDSVRPAYGGWTGLMDSLGLFGVFGSIWFRGTLVLLSASVLACSINRTPKLWRQAVHPRVVAGGAFFDHAALSASVRAGADAETAADELAHQLHNRRFRLVRTATPNAIAFYADRFRWGPYGTVIAHLSLIVILAGGMLGTTGFRNTDVDVTIGSTVDVGNKTGLSVEATSFTDSYYDNGQPSDYASHLVVSKAGQVVGEQTIRVNDPMRVDDVTFYQSYFGPAVDMKVTDASGAVLFNAGVPMPYGSKDDTRVYGQMTMPNSALTVWVIGVASGKVDTSIKPGQIELEVHDASSTVVGTPVLSQGQPATVAGLNFTFLRERQFTGLIVARDPGAPFIWLGALLLIGGVALVFFFPVRRIWARVRTVDGVAVIDIAAASRHDISFRNSFRTLIDNLELALGGASRDT